MGILVGPKSRFRKGEPFLGLSLRAPERCVAISWEKARLLRFARKDRILNRDLGWMFSLHCPVILAKISSVIFASGA